MEQEKLHLDIVQTSPLLFDNALHKLELKWVYLLYIYDSYVYECMIW